MSPVGSPWRSRVRGTTTGAPTQARDDTVPLSRPRSTPLLKPLAPQMIIRIPPNHQSSRVGAMESFQIRPRVGHGEIPSAAWLHQHHPKTTLCTLLLLVFLVFLVPSSLYSLLLIFPPLLTLYFLPLLLSRFSCLPLPLSGLFSLYQHLLMPISAHQSELKLHAFCVLMVFCFGCHDVTQLRGPALASLYLYSNIEGNVAVEGFDCSPNNNQQI